MLCVGVKPVLVARADEDEGTARPNEGIATLPVLGCLGTWLSLFGTKCVLWKLKKRKQTNQEI